ncbi:hypothetical protein SDC9_79979 [bioreactor metagenome]|uniref:Uncharacterized protein n=1 Tax=bioreactor metagenome TaxID=1076179 RepID=A0A644Z5M5_9ZZZZ
MGEDHDVRLGYDDQPSLRNFRPFEEQGRRHHGRRFGGVSSPENQHGSSGLRSFLDVDRGIRRSVPDPSEPFRKQVLLEARGRNKDIIGPHGTELYRGKGGKPESQGEKEHCGQWGSFQLHRPSLPT